ncbi:DUF5979 domain-containing protein [Microbacterium aoyamense]|uniref:DUF5979 domain-containing protein n=1 Tax=Microbacterium aoyamense TaxID=344166 RepID=UPI00200520D4|nr:DUF5979 domain-containing protein [Microbacterium aoyamense]
MKRTRRPLISALAVIALVAASAIGVTQPAFAADGDVLVTKTASVTTVQPGQTFSYTIVVNCTSILAGCTNATLTDTVPDEFEVLGATVGTGLQGDVNVDGQTVDVDFTMPMAGGTVGLPAGTTGIVTIQVRARDDLPYEANGIPVPNTATTDADTQTSGPLSSTVDVTPVVPLELATTIDKTMDPPSAVAAPGTPVTASITAGNTSNAAVDTVTITDPVDPEAPGNPFESLPFTGIDSVTYPTGAETAQVLVWDGDSWEPGPVATAPATPQPPASVPNDDVLGVQVVFTSTVDPGIEAGATGGVAIGMEHGPDAQSSPDNVTVTNTAQSEVDLDGSTATAEDSATHQIIAEDVEVSAGKSFSPTQVAAGDDSTVTLTAGNQSDFALTDMTITEPSLVGGDPFADGFDASLVFTGFSGGVAYPAGATAGTVTYYYDDDTSETLAFADGATPPPPSGTVVRFQITFTGDIPPTAQTSIPFDVMTDPEQTGYPADLPNEVTVEGTGPIGGTGSATASDILQVFERHIETITGKSIYPDALLDRPGEWVLVTLSGQVAPFPRTTTDATEVVIQDPETVPYDVDGTFWDEFDATEITQTAVPADASLSINYWDGDSWEPLPGAQDIQGPTTPPAFSMDIPVGLQDDILGLQFVYTAQPGESFPPGTSFEPHFTADKRTDERDDTTVTEAPDSVANCGSSSATAPGVDSTPSADSVACDDLPLLPVDDGDGDGPDVMDKSIAPSTLTSRAQQQATMTLNWSTGGFSNIDSMTIQDEAAPPTSTPTSLAGSFYDAFDIIAVPQITTTMDPHLEFDEISAVQLWDGTTWRDLANDPCPAACDGGFGGVTLTAADRAAALGIRLVFAESPTRAGTIVGDPTAPPVGSGVARSTGNDRAVEIVVELRDTRRSDGAPAMGDLDYNSDDTGEVLNTSAATGVDGGQTVLDSEDSATVLILDVPLNVTLDKTWSNSPFGVPPDGIPQSDYPTGRVTLVATNQTASKVDSLVLEDPAPGSPENPFTYFTLIGFTSIGVPPGADPAQTLVTLSRDADGDGVADGSQAFTISGALALTEFELANVVGVRVEYDGRIDAGATATVAMDLRLREFVRGQPTERVDQDASPVDNVAVVDIADAGGGTAGNITSDEDSASVEITDLELTVVADKTFEPDTQTEPDDSPVVMSLSGQPTGSARTYGMRIEDDAPTFWNAFDYAGIDPAFTLTTPINLVRMSVFTGGAFSDTGTDVAVTGGAWTVGPWLTEAAFEADPLPPGIAAGAVQGVRFEFLRDDDGDAVDPQQWENPTTPLQVVPVLVERRVDLRTGGAVPSDRSDLEAAPGESAPGQFSNDQTTTICSFLGQCGPEQGGEGETATAVADDVMHFVHATTAVEVTKSPVDGSAYAPDSVIPYQLTVTNSGDWPIEDPVIVDDPLQDGQLLVDPYGTNPAGPYRFALAGTAPVPPNGAPMPVDPAEVDIEDSGGQFVFTFPEGTVLEVGQSYTISIDLVFAVGLPGGTVVTNEATVTGDRPFDECNGTPGPVDECAVDTAVTVISAGATRSGKGVRPIDDSLGATNAVTGDECTPNALPIADPAEEGFYQVACVPRSKPGGEVVWRLAILNTGNIPMDTLVMIDRLPAPGDTGVLSGLQRESQWRPVFAGGVELVAPAAGATMNYLVTTGEVCADDLDATLDPSCPPGSWVDPSTVADLSTVTGIKVIVEFAAGSELAPGGIVLVDFDTITPAVSPAAGADTIAWNTVATGAHLTEVQTNGSSDMSPIEGTKTGVALATGSLRVVKTTSGDGERFAPDSFHVQLQCTSAVGTPVEEVLPPIDLTLTADEAQVVDDLPWGAECELVEGDNGQVDAGGTGGVVVSQEPFGTATLDNVYDLASLTLTKVVDDGGAVDQNGDPIEYGPFEATVECTFVGAPVWGDGFTESPMIVEITEGEPVTITGLPAGAECLVSESDTDGASSVVVEGETGDGPVGPGDESGITVILTPDDGESSTNSVDIENTFTVGSLDLLKVIDPADSVFANGPYVVHVTCTLDGDTTWDGDVVFDAPADDPATPDDDTDFAATIDDIATGSSCSVEETDDAFADSSTVSPSSVTIGDGTAVSVTITNFFPEGTLTVTKQLAGDTTWAPTSYTVRLTCLDPTSGALFLDIPGGPTRDLTEATGYTAAYDPLPAGAICVLVESDTGNASSTVIQDENGDPVGLFFIDEDVELDFTVVNTFETGQLEVTKQTSGDGADLWGTNEFEIELSCVADIGDGPVEIDIPGSAVRSFSDGETVLYDQLPPGAECTVAETDDGGASSVEITPNDGTDTATGVAVVDAGAPVELIVDNSFDVGELVVQKVISGDGEQWANGEFVVELTCTWDGSGAAEEIVVPGGAVRTLSRATGMSTTYTDLPDGAICSVEETDDADASAVTISPSAIVVTPGATVTLTVDNRFDAGSIHVQKVFSGPGEALGRQTTFTVELSCESFISGNSGAIDIPGGAVRVLRLLNGFQTTYDSLPDGAACVLSEIDDGGATSTTITPADGSVTVGANDEAELIVDNFFDSGDLVLHKVLEGDGAEFFGTGPFVMHVTCTLETSGGGTRTVYDEDVVLGGDEPLDATITGIPTGSVCAVEETDDGVADESVVEPSQVTIGAAQDAPVEVTATNTFLIGSLTVDKVVTGEGADELGQGPFEVTIRCIDPAGGLTQVVIPGGASRPLTAENGYTTTYQALPAGAICGIAETDDGGADSKRLLNAEGEEVGLITLESGSRVGFFRVQAGAELSFVLENTFDPPLPPTGFDAARAGAVATVGVGLLALGLGLVVVRRRRRA